METRPPPALKKGDTIAFVSTSARTHDAIPWRAERAKAFLEQEGYHVKIIHNSQIPHYPLRANAAARAEEVHVAFQDPSVKAIICAIGGSTANEMISALDPEIIRKNPKILSGGSDNTVMHHFCYVNGLRSFYGASAIGQLGEWPKPLDFTWDFFSKVTTSTEPVGPLPRSTEFTEDSPDRKTELERIANGTMTARVMKPSRGWKWLKAGKSEGVIWGGCLPSLEQMMGTKWSVSYQGKIAFIETPKGFPLDVAVCHVHNLRIKGVFDQIVGLVVGRPHGYSPEEEQTWEDEVERSTDGYDFPVLASVDVGHTDPILTVPLGAKAGLDSSRDLWEVLEAAVV